ncbi:AraD1 family protein [Tabrizicola oligotrophica]|uniref:GguC protein n=1 Tax=Tabrizicola oligotrophica TaxID=2710650 RepID=A0A6M0QPW9_9RHOB|nr:AraD1 family protein [Tabrizicola oligotrophica]NEY89530.1 GguC protein [Tabrizicola oligotrophica]
MLISQILQPDGRLAVVVRDGTEAAIVRGATSTYALAEEAIAKGQGLAATIAAHGLGEAVDLPALLAAGRVTLPITHPDAAHMHLTGTGLTHLGSAAARDAMHTKLAGAETLTDSMKMFRMGLEGGKPAAGAVGVQPEWFYKGNGTQAVAPGAALTAPGFAEDGGEEPEIAGIYLIGPDGTPHRIGWALANEFSDHVTERVNYLWLAHSKLRPAAFGPEILVGDLPVDIRGTSRVRRAGAVIWEKPFLSGEANMSHSFANLEHHHFKYGLFRQPGDLHVHMFGTATLSFADGIKTEAGDVFEIEAAPFGLSLTNPLAFDPAEAGPTAVHPL